MLDIKSKKPIRISPKAANCSVGSRSIGDWIFPGNRDFHCPNPPTLGRYQLLPINVHEPIVTASALYGASVLACSGS